MLSLRHESIAKPNVQRLGGPVGTAVGSLMPLDPPTTTFRGTAGTLTAGYVVGITPTVPGVAVGGNASILVRLIGPSGFSQDYGPYTVNGLGGGTVLPPNMQLGTSPLGYLCPEPSTMHLAALGIGASFVDRITWRIRQKRLSNKR